MSIIVTDTGFAADDWDDEVTSLENWPDAGALDVPADAEFDALDAALAAQRTDMIRVAFPAFNDGRGFTIARHLRESGYAGRLRAHGHILADQYTMARRSGFDEVEIDETLAARQPDDQWLARANWRAHDYRSRLGGHRPSPGGR